MPTPVVLTFGVTAMRYCVWQTKTGGRDVRVVFLIGLAVLLLTLIARRM